MTDNAAPDFSGHNEIRLNTATMKDIVQFWLAHKWSGIPPKVDYVSLESTGTGSQTFIVRTVTEAKE